MSALIYLVRALRRQRRWILTFLFYFFCLLVFTFHVSWQESTVFSNSSPWLTPGDVAATSLYGDPVSFLEAATDISSTGWYTQSTQWVSELWPPGFVLLQAFIIRIFGLNVPLPFVIQALACLIFSLNLSILSKILDYRGVIFPLNFLAPLLLFVLASTRGFFLGPYGSLFGESVAAALFLLGLLLACLAAYSSQKVLLVIAGSIALGASAYFRSQFEMYVNSVAIVFSLASVVCFLWFRVRSPRYYLSFCKLSLISLLICFFVMLPWRAYRIMNSGTASWVSTSNLTYHNSVASTNVLIDSGGGFVVEGGGNLACALAPSVCGKTHQAKNIFYSQLFRQFPSWVKIKASLFPRYAFAEYHPRGFVVPNLPITLSSVLSRLLLLGAFIALGVRSFVSLIRAAAVGSCVDGQQAVTLLFVFGILTASVPIWLLCHYEVRYFYTPWLFLSTFVVLLLPGKCVSLSRSR